MGILAPLKIGIVGSEQAKFTPETEANARWRIREILIEALVARAGQPIYAVSGHCHLGGVDIYVEQEAAVLHKTYPDLHLQIFPPKRLQWEGGYKQRNLKIAESDIVHCITVSELPPDYTGMRFKSCYHCLRHGEIRPHVKSGGCWTMYQCKQHVLWIIE